MGGRPASPPWTGLLSKKRRNILYARQTHPGVTIFMNASPRSLPPENLAATTPLEMALGDAIFRELFEGAPIGMAVLALDERFLQVTPLLRNGRHSKKS